VLFAFIVLPNRQSCLCCGFQVADLLWPTVCNRFWGTALPFGPKGCSAEYGTCRDSRESCDGDLRSQAAGSLVVLR